MRQKAKVKETPRQREIEKETHLPKDLDLDFQMQTVKETAILKH